jgi:putative aldouronate transport system substrate-binding protein
MKAGLLFKTIFSVLCIASIASCSNAVKTDNRNTDVNLAEIISEARGLKLEKEGADLQSQELEQIGPIGQVKRGYDDIKAQYPDKSILKVWGICPSDYITDELNKYLVSNGCDYVIYFMERTQEDMVMVKPTVNAAEKAAKYERLLQLLDNADIVPVERDYFYNLVKEDCIEPWNDYLATDNGKELRNCLPESNWLSANIKGVVYGINGRADYVNGPPSYIINKELMRKYNLTEEDLNKPIYELGDILTRIAEGEKSRHNFCTLAIDSVSYINLHGTASAYIGTSALTLSTDPAKDVIMALEDPEYLQWLNAINQYAGMGLVGYADNQLDNFFLKVKTFSSLPFINPNYGFYYNHDGDLAGEQDVAEIVLNKYYDGSISYQPNGFYCNAISRRSQNKLQAFDFLKRVYTDSYLTNLLLYGIENRNYKLTDGKVDWPIVNINDNCIGNAYLAYPRYYEYSDKKERYIKLQNAYPYTYYDFYFDREKVEAELSAVNSTMNKINDILNGGVEDFDIFIKNLKNELYDKGITIVIDEINRQKGEWLDGQTVE